MFDVQNCHYYLLTIFNELGSSNKWMPFEVLIHALPDTYTLGEYEFVIKKLETNEKVIEVLSYPPSPGQNLPKLAYKYRIKLLPTFEKYFGQVKAEANYKSFVLEFQGQLRKKKNAWPQSYRWLNDKVYLADKQIEFINSTASRYLIFKTLEKAGGEWILAASLMKQARVSSFDNLRSAISQINKSKLTQTGLLIEAKGDPSFPASYRIRLT